MCRQPICYLQRRQLCDCLDDTAAPQPQISEGVHLQDADGKERSISAADLQSSELSAEWTLYVEMHHLRFALNNSVHGMHRWLHELCCGTAHCAEHFTSYSSCYDTWS